MPNLTSELLVKLVDGVTGPAKTVADALKKAESQIKAIDAAMGAGNGSTKFREQLASLGRSSADIERVSQAWKQYTASVGAAGNAANWTKGQAQQIKSWEAQTISSLKAVTRAEEQARRASSNLPAPGPGGRDHTGRNMILGGAAIAGAHKVGEFGKESLVKYREQDSEYRYLAAVAGLNPNSPEAQAYLQQAISGSANSKYNDIEWLKAQRNLRSKDLSDEAVRAITPTSAHLGQAMGVGMNDATNLLESGMFTFNKPRTAESATQTADAMVKASKISGMDANDLEQVYKYGGAIAHIGGITEPTLLGFGAMAKKAQMGGQESGTAFRALMKNIYSPDRQAKEALMAAGIDYSQYQKEPKQIVGKDFARMVGIEYGKELSPLAMGRLDKVFANKAITSDPVKYGSAVTDILSAEMPGKEDAQNRKNIAGFAQRYRNASVPGVRADDLLKEIEKHGDNLGLMQSFMGSKQGSRLATVLGDDPEFKKKIAEIATESQGYAKNISDQRMAGFDGAVSRFESAVLNMQTAIGRSFDKSGPNGEPGMLTRGADMAGKLAQSFAELDGKTVKLISEIGLAAAGLAGLKGFQALAGGFGLSTSANLLDKAAAHLMAVGGGGAAGGLAGGEESGKAGKKPAWVRRGGRAIGGALSNPANLIPGVGGALWANEAAPEAQAWQKAHPEGWKGLLEANRQPLADAGYTPGGSITSGPVDSGWSLNNKTTPWPMVGKTGATAGATESPADVTAPFNGIAGVAPQMGSSAGSGFSQGLLGELQALVPQVQAIMEQLRGAMDFSATPQVNSPAAAPAPRSSSLTNYDHGRSSGGGGVTIGQ